MNRFGRQAMQHWKEHLPQRYAEIPDPEEFFTDLGQRVENEITELSTQLAGDDPPWETYLDKVGRLNMARLRAEEIVVREEVLPAPETDEETDEETDGETEEETADSGWIPIVEDDTSPYWVKVREQAQEAGSDPTR